MIILLLKSQPGLFDKLVHVSGSVSSDGTVRAPHMAIRRVRAPQPKVERPQSLDLFEHADKQAAVPEKPKPQPKPKPAKPETMDLFEAKPAPAPEKMSDDDLAATVKQYEDLPDLPPMPEPEKAPWIGAGIDYSEGFAAVDVPSFGVPAGTSKEKRRSINATAAAMIDANDTSADAKSMYAKYSGNGGCGDSLNEFYTDPKVAAAMWSALAGLGVSEGATALEPSCATGVFMRVAPQGVKVTGVELDNTSARMAAVLHPGHEVKNSSLEAFATQDDRQFDVVIGNAPFGLRGGLLSQDKKHLSTAEGYFLDTALDKAKSGGIVAMIVPTGVMDSKRDRKLRENLMRKGQFLGALRMPNTAFEHSHTGVTTDVVFFRKRDQDVANALAAVDQETLRKLGVWDDDYLSGSYFTERGAANVLGTMTEGWRAKAGMGDDITVEGSMIGVPESIAAFSMESGGPAPSVADILAAVPEETRERVRGAVTRSPYSQGRRGDTKTVDGVQYILEGEPLRWHRVDEFMQNKAVTDAQSLSADIARAIDGEDVPGLKERVEAYVQAHGIPSKDQNLMIAAATDKSIYRLIGAVKADGSLSDVVSGRKADVVESSFDAAAQSLALENVWFTPDQVTGIWRAGNTEAALDHLYASTEYAIDPVSGMWTSMDQYLSGELWPKYDELKAALAGEMKPEDKAKYERQLQALDDAIAPQSLEDVEVSLNSAFVPLHVIEAYWNHDDAKFTGQYAPQRLKLSFEGGVYTVKGGGYDAALLDKYLNRTGVKKDDWPTVEAWNAAFKEWLCAAPERVEVEELYNRNFRGFRQREYSDKPFEIPGLNTDGIKPHVYSGIRRALESGKGILADDVGLGKTVQGLILARMAKVTGQAKKPMIVVPKSVLANWVAEAEKWFPGSNVLVIGETYKTDKNGKLTSKPDTASERNRKYHDLTQNDYDFVLISQPAWNDLDLDPITKGEYVEGDFWVQRGDSLGNAGDKRTGMIREAYKQAMARRDFDTRTDAIYFNDLGVDMIIGDEMHAYKNLYSARNRFGQAPKFLGGSGLSNRALDMSLKTRWVREKNDGKNVYGLTATPTKNSPLEIYSMLTHIAPEAFEKIGIRNSEEFLDRFCEFRQENILNTRGEIEEALVTAGFKNLDELREIMRRYINRRTADDVGLKIPARDDRQHLVDMTAKQREVYDELRELAEKAQGKDATGDAHIFAIMNKMSKAAMDLEMYDGARFKGATSPKYDEAVKHIAAGAKDGGQVVFADNVMVHDKMVEALVASGIPRDQIAIINAQVADSSAKRQNVSDAFNSGKIKVVIGNTATMGEGINLQKGTTDIHHLDLPWEPASMQQRNGRGVRQGNISEAVRLHTYLAKGSFDGYRYQSMMAKKNWQDLLWGGGNKVENLAREGAISRDDLMVMLAADPEAAREQLTANKAMAEERFKALKTSEAAQEFDRYNKMRRSFKAMGGRERETPAGQRLKVKMDRMKNALESNSHFHAKAALDSDVPVIVHPETGEMFREGVGYEDTLALGDDVRTQKFVVVSVDPSVSRVRVRRYGDGGRTPHLVDIRDLDKAKPFDYSAEAEADHMAEAFASAAESKLGNLKRLSDLHGLPSAVIHRAKDTIQKVVNEGAKSYNFDLGYGNVGLVAPDGTISAPASYEARKLIEGGHDVMLPTDDNRAKAIAAYMADEREKSYKTSYQTVRGRSTPQQVLSYPGAYDQKENRWGRVLNSVWGEGALKEAQAQFSKEQAEVSRRAPSFGEALNAASKAAIGQHGVKAWTKRSLAVLWAKAKRDGALDKPMSEFAKDKLTMTAVNPSGTVRDSLMRAARDMNIHDLSSVMAVDNSNHDQAVTDVLNTTQFTDSHRAALRHIITKNPAMAERRAGDFNRFARPSYYGSQEKPHPLRERYGDSIHHMTVKQIAESVDE